MHTPIAMHYFHCCSTFSITSRCSTFSITSRVFVAGADGADEQKQYIQIHPANTHSLSSHLDCLLFDSDLRQIAAYNVTVTAYNSTTSRHKQPSFTSNSCRSPPRVCNSCASILTYSSMRVTIQPYLQSQLTHNSITQTHVHMHPLRIAHCGNSHHKCCTAHRTTAYMSCFKVHTADISLMCCTTAPEDNSIHALLHTPTLPAGTAA